MSDSDLLGRLLAGEQTAYCELVARYQGAMRAVAYAIVGSRHTDEVEQDAWLAVVRSLAGFQERSSLKNWLLTITANTAKTRLKHIRREVLLDDLAAPHGTVGDERFADDGHWLLAPHAWHQDSPETLLTEDELRQCLEHTLASLSELQTSVLVLRERQAWSWRRSVIFSTSPSPIPVCCCTGHVLGCLGGRIYSTQFRGRSHFIRGHRYCLACLGAGLGFALASSPMQSPPGF